MLANRRIHDAAAKLPVYPTVGAAARRFSRTFPHLGAASRQDRDATSPAGGQLAGEARKRLMTTYKAGYRRTGYFRLTRLFA